MYEVTVEDMRNLSKALRSGNYKQTTGRLRRGDCYCAEGVLADVIKEKAGLEWKALDWAYPNELSIGNDVEGWFTGVFQVPKEQSLYHLRLMHMNDQEDLTFPQIADAIDAYLAERGL